MCIETAFRILRNAEHRKVLNEWNLTLIFPLYSFHLLWSIWCFTFQGSLYVLLGPKENPLVTRHDWEMLMSLWPAIVRTKPSEKLSVIRLMENIVECVHKHFPTITINLQVSLLLYASVWTRWLLIFNVHNNKNVKFPSNTTLYFTEVDTLCYRFRSVDHHQASLRAL